MPRPQKRLLWQKYECSLDAIELELVEKILSGNVFSDPVFDAVAKLQEPEVDAILDDDAFDSTAVNPFWALADFYASQWIILKRSLDKEDYAENGRKRQRRIARAPKASCSALHEVTRKRCPRTARYVLRLRTKSGNWSYQRRCEACFQKVVDKRAYGPIAKGRYF